MADAPFAASGTIELTGEAGLIADSLMAAKGGITLGGSAWMTTGGDCDMKVTGTIALRPRWTRMIHDGDVLPATDGTGWTTPSRTPPDIREDA